MGELFLGYQCAIFIHSQTIHNEALIIVGFATGSSRHVRLEYNMQLLPLQVQSYSWSCSYE